MLPVDYPYIQKESAHIKKKFNEIATWSSTAEAYVHSMALTPDGKKLYVANGRSDTVSVIDTEKNVKLTDIAVGSFPWGVVIQ